MSGSGSSRDMGRWGGRGYYWGQGRDMGMWKD